MLEPLDHVAAGLADDHPEDYQERAEAMLDAADQLRKQRKENPECLEQARSDS